MGKQIGVVRISGKGGNLTFAHGPNGDEVRLNTSLTGDQMQQPHTPIQPSFIE